jgi:hypothetical protein
VAQEELIAVQREIARTNLDYGAYGAAARAYRAMARAAAFVGDDDAVDAARQVLRKMPADFSLQFEDEAHWTRWRDTRLKVVAQARPGEDPHGPLRTADPRPELWKSVDLTAMESAPVGPPGVRLVRAGNEVGLDTDGDGKADTPLDLQDGGSIEFRATYPDGLRRRYALQARRYGVFEYMNFTFDHTRRCIVFVRRDGYREANLGGVRVRITDDDCDGRFDGFGRDGITIGRSAAGTLLSRIIATPKGIYEIDVHPAGTEIRWRKYKGPTLIAQPSPGFGVARNFIIRSADDPDLFLELAPVRTAVKIPTGRWQFHQAVLLDPTGTEMVWVDGRDCAPLDLPEEDDDEILVFRLGGTLQHRCQVTLGEEEVRIHGLTFALVGEAGEVYQGYYPTPVVPEISVLMPIPGTEREIRNSGQCLQRDSTSPNHLEVGFPKDVVFEFEPAGEVALQTRVEHPILGQVATPWALVERPEPKAPPPEAPGAGGEPE